MRIHVGTVPGGWVCDPCAELLRADPLSSARGGPFGGPVDLGDLVGPVGPVELAADLGERALVGGPCWVCTATQTLPRTAARVLLLAAKVPDGWHAPDVRTWEPPEAGKAATLATDAQRETNSAKAEVKP